MNNNIIHVLINNIKKIIINFDKWVLYILSTHHYTDIYIKIVFNIFKLT